MVEEIRASKLFTAMFTCPNFFNHPGCGKPKNKTNTNKSTTEMNYPYLTVILLSSLIVTVLATATVWAYKRRTEEVWSSGFMFVSVAITILLVADIVGTTVKIGDRLQSVAKNFEWVVENKTADHYKVSEGDMTVTKLDYAGMLEGVIKHRDSVVREMGSVGIFTEWRTDGHTCAYKGAYINKFRFLALLGIWIVDILAMLVIPAAMKIAAAWSERKETQHQQ